jgi:hypothetical protein
MTVDPILALQSLGYTEREASFLYLVAVHSGYFLRRQFDYFIDRNKGAIVHAFLEKARIAGHIEVIDYGEARHVYHLFSKPIYRLLGSPESQYRRRKSDGFIRGRLITLDYILENDRDHYFESDEDKTSFFADVRKIPSEFFADSDGRLFPELRTSPISVSDRTQPDTSLVRVLFADEALLSTAKFNRFLLATERLLRALMAFEVIYAASSVHNFADAETTFQNRFAPAEPAKQTNLGEDWRLDSARISPRSAPLRGQFTTLLLHSSYPRIQRNELRSLATVRRLGLKRSKEIIENKVDGRKRGQIGGKAGAGATPPPGCRDG